MQYNTIQCSTMQYNTKQYSTEYSTVHDNTIQYNVTQLILSIPIDELRIKARNLHGFYHSHIFLYKVVKGTEIVGVSKHCLYENGFFSKSEEFDYLFRPISDLYHENMSNNTKHRGVEIKCRNTLGNIVIPRDYRSKHDR